MYEINGLEKQATIEKIGFSNLLDVFFDCADCFSLSQALWTNAINDTLKNNLEPFLEKKITTPKWFGYDYSIAPREDYREIDVYIYRATPAAKEVFLNMFSDIFLRVFKENDYQDSFQSLEDLCFFHNKKLVMGTVSHEFLLSIAPINSVVENIIIETEGWIPVEDSTVCLEGLC